MKLMKEKSELPRILIEGFMQVCNKKNVAFMVPSVLKKTLDKKIPCKLSSISTHKIINLGIAFSKNNPYTHLMNHYLQKFVENGALRRLFEAYSTELTKDEIRKSVYLFNVIPTLTILYGGFIISIMILITEKIHYLLKKIKFQSRVFYPSRKLFLFKKSNN